MTTDESIYTCPGCAGEMVALDHPFVAAITHAEGCSLNNGDDPDYVAALGALFAGRERGGNKTLPGTEINND